ncbi:acyltransferase family protein [Brachybacterium fresconis]|uniref:Peptidoglycan/LPS O-acetylase OafA/YrhL n=1 Tax=Brachybacterium fresconis TaxID=173363 RepID=A0ABS4YJV2_9MICO|nr:peptidoglycan/LPS O-acetylase OafA/YrhL [Brachybacterium fresconis]
MTAVGESTSAAPAAKKSGFRPDVQGLRAIAVLFVVLYHSGVTWLSGGFVGVDVFFVISGFLITTHLLESLERDGRISFGSFYAKRARRILPASLLVGIATVLAAWIWMPPLLMNEVAKGAVAVALYVPNMLFAVEGTNYLAETSPSVFQHYWSLGVEEQFYLFWPAILAVGFWLCRRSERRLLVVSAVLVAVSFALCVALMSVSQPWVFFSLPTRAWELGAGALVAFLLRSGARWPRAAGTGALSWVGLALLAVVGLVYTEQTPFPGYTAALPVLATVLLIIGGAAPGRGSANRILGLRPFQFVGAISYSLYLVHWPLQVIPQVAVGEDNPLPLWLRLALGAVAIPLAWLLFRFVERPVIAWPTLRKRSRLWTGAAALATSAALIATAGGSYYLTSARGETATNQTAGEETQLQKDPAGTGFVPENLTPPLEEAEADNPSIYASDCHRPQDSTDSSGCRVGENEDAPLVFLFGDSHAASWYPALAELAEQGKIRLDTNTKSSCPSVDVPLVLEGVTYTECDTWRQGVIDRINEEQPDLVLLANYGAERPELEGGGDFATRWQQGMESTIDAIEGPGGDGSGSGSDEAGADGSGAGADGSGDGSSDGAADGSSSDGPVVDVLADVPDQGETSAVCLSKNLEDTAQCAVPRGEAFDPAVTEAEQSAAETTGARYVDLTAYLCNESMCPPIIGNVLVYRDGHHLTTHFSRLMAEPLWEEIEASLG